MKQYDFLLVQRLPDPLTKSGTLGSHYRHDHRSSEVLDLALWHRLSEHSGLTEQIVLEHIQTLVASKRLTPALAVVPSARNQLRVISVMAIESNAIEEKIRIALSEVILDNQTIREADALEVGVACCTGVSVRQVDVVLLIVGNTTA